jgi:hypothetical protein
MKKYILFENLGEIEANALFLLGASPKRNDDTKIGQFGSGLKYGPATLMRHNVEMRVFSGTSEIVLGTVKEVLRGKEFEVITINGRTSSITVDAGGVDWQLWYAIREIYANALDECVTSFRTDVTLDEINGFQGFTRIYIEITNEVADILKNWDRYFSFKRTPLFETNTTTEFFYKCIDDLNLTPIKVFRPYEAHATDPTVTEHKTRYIYRKGFQVHTNHSTLFDYDIENCKINEARQLVSTSSLDYAFRYMIAKAVNKKWLDEVFDAKNITCREITSLSGMDIETMLDEKWKGLSEENLLVVREVAGNYDTEIAQAFLTNRKVWFLPMSFARALKHNFNDDVRIFGFDRMIGDVVLIPFNETGKTAYLLKSVIGKLNEMDYHIGYDVKIMGNTEGSYLCDMANKTIYISHVHFDNGLRSIATVLMTANERMNLKLVNSEHGLSDHFLNKWLSVMETSTGIFF